MSQSPSDQNLIPVSLDRRTFIVGAAGFAVTAALGTRFAFGQGKSNGPVNLAKVAQPSSSYTSGDTRVSAMNDGFEPRNSADNEQDRKSVV